MTPSTDRPLTRAALALATAALRWLAVGAVVGVAVSAALLWGWGSTPRGATDTAFALGALVLGFGVLAWSTAVGLGRTIEGMQEQLDVNSRWTEAGARQAFFVLSWTGAGWVLAAAVTAVALGV